MSVKLPSVIDSDSDSLYAADEKLYLFENSNNLPDDVLINQNLPLPQEMSARSVKVPGTTKPGFSEIYRNGALPNGIKETIIPELNTYPKIFASSVKRQSGQPCLAHHEYDYENEQHLEKYVSQTYQQVDNRKTNFFNGLMFLLESNPYKNLSLESHQRIVNHSKEYASFNHEYISFIVTLYSGNRAEWVITDLACSANSVTTTALYDTLGPESSKYILNLTQSPVVVCSRNKVEALIKLKAANPKELESLITIISMDPLKVKGKSYASLVELAERNNIKLYDFDQVEKTGEVFPREETSPTPNTVYTLTFTSGTTGANPKGVVLSQRSIVSAILTYVTLLPHHKSITEFEFLPLAHIFERHMCCGVLTAGGTVGFPRLGGTPQTLFEDLKLFKPSFLGLVPRILTKIEAAIKAATVDSSSRVSRTLYSSAIEAKQSKQEKNGDRGDHFLFDKTLIKILRSKFGFDNMESCITGSAPIAPDTIKFLKASLGIGITQGYGLSESFSGVFLALPFHSPSVGTCGAISPTVEARLRELPEMGYHLNDEGGPRGELQLRGAQMFSHYYKNPEETKKSIDEDG
ncbi:Long-chain-fatty-acid--CoA ligase 2, partial [Candida parapsilosis]